MWKNYGVSWVPEDAWRTSLMRVSQRVRLLAASACSKLTSVSWTLEHNCRSVSRSRRPNRAPSSPVSVIPPRRCSGPEMVAGVPEDAGRSVLAVQASDKAWSDTSAASRCTSWRRHAITARRSIRCGLNSISWQQSTQPRLTSYKICEK